MADLRYVKGDTNVYSLSVIRQNAPVNLTGSKVWFTAKLDDDYLDDAAAIKINSEDHPLQIVFVDAVHGQVQIVLLPQDTENLINTAFYYDVQVVETSGVVTTVARGVLRVVKDITKAIA